MNESIIEPKRQIPVKGVFDVSVVGAGIAGVAAALSAARLGKKVVLIDRLYTVGGLATQGLIAIYLPLCDGKGHQVSFSIAQELLLLSMSRGNDGRYPDAWLTENNKERRVDQRYQVQYNPNVFSILMEQLLLQSGVTLLFGVTACSVQRSGNRISYLIIEGKSGRSALETGFVVDCTGDADIARLCGLQTCDYKAGNSLAAWYYELINGKNELRKLGVVEDFNEGRSKGVYHGTDERDLTQMALDSHKVMLDHFSSHGDSNPSHSMTCIPGTPQLRMTRRIEGMYCLDESESFKSFGDSIGLISDWRNKGPVFEVPFRSLRTGGIENLLFAGRCISATDAMWDITRVIPACAVTGEAAGAAAAIDDASYIALIQEVLKSRGVPLHSVELGI